MRVAEDEFVGLFLTDICHVEVAFFLADKGIEANVHEYVAQFLADVLTVVFHQCVAQLKHLFDGVGPQALVGLFPVPGTFHTQTVEHIEEPSERFYFFFS